MRRMSFILFILFLVISSLSAEENIPETKLEDLSWLAGKWRGEVFGGICEEYWYAPSGGSMLGTFKLINDDEVSFYEIMIITVDSTGPVLKLKHFNSDLTGWEEKDEVRAFPFKEINENEILFDGVNYKLLSENQLRIGVIIGDKEGESHEVEILCKRVD